METQSLEGDALGGKKSSYRTYEEWKLRVYPSGVGAYGSSSYRTYEEWKPKSLLAYSPAESAFLPYLWGMETAPSSRQSPVGCLVLTVPMRNGN